MDFVYKKTIHKYDELCNYYYLLKIVVFQFKQKNFELKRIHNSKKIYTLKIYIDVFLTTFHFEVITVTVTSVEFVYKK